MRMVFGALGLIFVGLAVFEVTMQPVGSERLELAVIFGAMAALMVLLVMAVPRFSRSVNSVRLSVGVIMVVSFAIVAVGVSAAAERMFISQHDLTLLLVVIGFGVVAAAGFAIAISGPMTRDLERLASAADQVAEGDLDVHLEIDRRDELGRLAVSLERMVDGLRSVEEERLADAAARRSFFAAVGHDLRTPLASLRAAVEAFQDGLVQEPNRYLAAMEKDIAALSALVDDLNLLARIESGGLEVEVAMVDLTELADEAVDVISPLAAAREIEIEVVSRHPVMVECGPEAVGRVIRNLLDNAVRHSPPGSTVEVTVTTEGRPTVTVVDQGAGFDSEFVAQAFDRFSRDDPARMRGDGGSGLGLAIAQGFIHALDGEIWAEPGPGGKVGFRLPV